MGVLKFSRQFRSAILTPTAGNTSIFIDATNGILTTKDENGIFKVVGSSEPINTEELYLDGSAPSGGDGTKNNPFNKFSLALASIPLDGRTYNIYIKPFQYTESTSTVNLPNTINLNLIGEAQSNTFFNFGLNFTAISGSNHNITIKNLNISGSFNLDLTGAVFASLVLSNGSISLNRIDSNPNTLVILQETIYDSTISGNVYLDSSTIFGIVTVNSPATLYANNVIMLGGFFNLIGNCTLKTLSVLNPSANYVNGTTDVTGTPTWLTDIASDAVYTGTLNKIMYTNLPQTLYYTPTSSADTNGNIGDLAWDDNFIYQKVSTGWKRTALSSF